MLPIEFPRLGRVKLYFVIRICNAVEASHRMPFFHVFSHASFYSLSSTNYCNYCNKFCYSNESYSSRFRFLRTYIFDLSILVQRYSPCSCHDAGRTHTRSISSYFPGEFFTVVPKIIVKGHDTIPIPSISVARLWKQIPTIEETVEIIETRIFFLNRAGKCTASFRINECKIPSERNCFGVRS